MSVVRSKDSTEIEWQSAGKPMMQVFKTAPEKPNIFEDFELMD